MDDGGGEGAVLTSITTVAETGSTNADMLAAARGGAAEAAWLRAGRQREGRGRLGRVWNSPVGNLYASTIVRVGGSDPAAATLALVAAVALEETVGVYWSDRASALLPPAAADLSLKWPNDLLVDGAKISGILLERADDAVVIGIGVNLAHHPDLPDRATASLAEYGIAVAPDAFLDTLAEAFARWLARWRGEGIAPVRARWLDRAHAVGTALTARLPDGSAIDGLFDGLDRDGALILRLGGGERRVIHAGDVFLL